MDPPTPLTYHDWHLPTPHRRCHHVQQLTRTAAAAVCHPEIRPCKVSHIEGLAGMPERTSSFHHSSRTDQKGKGCHCQPVVNSAGSEADRVTSPYGDVASARRSQWNVSWMASEPWSVAHPLHPSPPKGPSKRRKWLLQDLHH